MTPAKKTAATTTKTTAKRASTSAFSDAERDAMKERAKESKKAKGADQEDDLLAKIAEMDGSDKAMAEHLHTLIKAHTDLASKTWYGMPAYTKDGKTICFFQPAAKFKTRYATLGFSNDAQLDDGNMWPNAYALTTIGAAEEKRIIALLKQAVG